MTTAVDWLWLQWERVYPTACGIAAGILAFCYGPKLGAAFAKNDWSVENLYLAVLTIATVASGFTFATYTFLLTTESGFIGRAKNSIYYRHMLTYVLRATILGGIVAVATIPFFITKLTPVNILSQSNLLIAFWAALTVGTIAAFYRAAYLFAIFARQHH